MPNRDARIIAFVNQKGGVGKTTSCVNLAAALSAASRRVLLIDLDPQGNATMGCGVNKYALKASVNEVLLRECRVEAVCMPKTVGGFDLLPANGDLTAAEVNLVTQDQRERRLKAALVPVLTAYDFVLIDCPPALNLLTLNALVAATGLIIPMQCEYYALEGLTALMETFEQVKQSLNPPLAIEGILRTLFDGRNRLAGDVSAQLRKHFPKQLYQTVIPQNVRLAEAPSHGMPVLLYDKRCRGALAYTALAQEILRRQKNSSLSGNLTKAKKPVKTKNNSAKNIKTRGALA